VKSVFDSRKMKEIFLFSRSFLGSIQPPLQWVSEAFSPEVKLPMREAYYINVEIRNIWSYTSTPLYVFMAWSSIITLYLANVDNVTTPVTTDSASIFHLPPSNRKSSRVHWLNGLKYRPKQRCFLKSDASPAIRTA
jgi:hypothetical protein